MRLSPWTPRLSTEPFCRRLVARTQMLHDGLEGDRRSPASPRAPSAAARSSRAPSQPPAGCRGPGSAGVETGSPGTAESPWSSTSSGPPGAAGAPLGSRGAAEDRRIDPPGGHEVGLPVECPPSRPARGVRHGPCLRSPRAASRRLRPPPKKPRGGGRDPGDRLRGVPGKATRVRHGNDTVRSGRGAWGEQLAGALRGDSRKLRKSTRIDGPAP